MVTMEVWDRVFIPEWAICALEYGENEGGPLTETETAALRQFIATLPAGYVVEYQGEPFFSHCNALLYQGGTVLEAVIYYFEGD